MAWEMDLSPGGEDSEDDEDADKLDIRAAMRPEQLQGMIKQGRARRLSGKSAGSGAADAADDSEAESGMIQTQSPGTNGLMLRQRRRRSSGCFSSPSTR